MRAEWCGDHVDDDERRSSGMSGASASKRGVGAWNGRRAAHPAALAADLNPLLKEAGLTEGGSPKLDTFRKQPCGSLVGSDPMFPAFFAAWESRLVVRSLDGQSSFMPWVMLRSSNLRSLPSTTVSLLL